MGWILHLKCFFALESPKTNYYFNRAVSVLKEYSDKAAKEYDGLTWTNFSTIIYSNSPNTLLLLLVHKLSLAS